jgi:hypothetical protein
MGGKAVAGVPPVPADRANRESRVTILLATSVSVHAVVREHVPIVWGIGS